MKSPAMKVAFIGLGNMGGPMAGHLVRGGHEVTVFNRTSKRAEDWAARHGGTIAASPAAAAEGAEVVCTCVGDDDDVREVLLGDRGALSVLLRGAVVVDHTTASATLARELGEACVERGIGFLDAPVSGGQSGAENASLSVMCGGDEVTLERVRPILECYATSITLIGVIGSGQLTKMVNQILCAANIEGVAEALNFAMAAGLDTDRVLAAVTKGAAGSWYLENRGHTMVRGEFDFGFAVDWLRKDLRICLAEAGSLGVSLPVAELASVDFEALHDRGEGRSDVSVAIRLRHDESES